MFFCDLVVKYVYLYIFSTVATSALVTSFVPLHFSIQSVRSAQYDMLQCTEPAKGPPPYSPAGEGLSYAQGPHARCEKNSSFFYIYSKYKMNKMLNVYPKLTSLLLFIAVQ